MEAVFLLITFLFYIFDLIIVKKSFLTPFAEGVFFIAFFVSLKSCISKQFYENTRY